MRKKIYLLPLLLLALILYSCANESIAFKKGEQAFAIGEYYFAAGYYKQSYSRCSSRKDKDKRAVRAFKMGDCYRRINMVQKAVSAFQNAVRYEVADSTAYLLLAQQLMKTANYKAAEQYFRQYLELCPSSELAYSGILSCELAQQWKDEDAEYTVARDPVFNSRRSDFSPVLLGDDSDNLILTSTRNEVKGDEDNGITGNNYSDLFLAKKDESGKWKQPEVVDSEVNTDYDEGACCVSPDGRTMYFTRCTSDPDYPRNAEIWQSARSDAAWAKPSKCEISKDTLSSFAHPAVSPDGRWLYFVSDMPGGLGGYDVWRVMLMEGGHFGGVENLGRPVNTEGDELFPTFRFNGELYFSSDGHPGMGGLDIFCATHDSINGWTVENLKSPVNSPMDDFGMTFEGKHTRGFFASSRGDNRGWEHIYSFEKPEIVQTVTGWVYEKDGYELPEALVYMVGNDGTNEKVSVKGDGSFTKELVPGVDYVFLGTCEGYLNIRQHLKVQPSKESKEYTLQFPLPPINIPVIIDNIFYEFNKATLTDESTEALDKLVAMMTENEHVTIELSSHCDYRGNDEYNQGLSQRRAESVVNYLIEHGIASDRLTATGYGESVPKIVTKKIHERLPFLNENDTLTEAFITSLTEEQQDTCNALNRRTEFKVLRTNYGLTIESLIKEAEKEAEQNNKQALPQKEEDDEDDFIYGKGDDEENTDESDDDILIGTGDEDLNDKNEDAEEDEGEDDYTF